MMAEYLLLMRDDAVAPESDWEPYLTRLKESGALRGGSAIGDGVCLRKSGDAAALSGLSGFVRVEAESLSKAQLLLQGNPVFEAGGTVEIRELPGTE